MSRLLSNNWDLLAFLLIFAFIVPWRGAVRIRKLLARPKLTLAERLLTYASTIALQWLLTALIAWRAAARHISAAQLGVVITNRALTIILAIALSLFLAALQYIGARRTASLTGISTHRLAAIAIRLMPEELLDSLVFVALAITAGLCEEFIYRGFFYAEIFRHLGAPIALILSSILFSVAHAYQGRRGMLSTLILGFILGASRLWTGNLLPAVCAHTVVDLAAGLVAARYIRKAVAAESAVAQPTTSAANVPVAH